MRRFAHGAAFAALAVLAAPTTAQEAAPEVQSNTEASQETEVDAECFIEPPQAPQATQEAKKQPDGEKPSVAKDVGSAVGGTAGQIAGATVAGPIGAAAGGVIVERVGRAVGKLIKGKKKKKPAQNGQPATIVCVADETTQPAN